MSVDLYADPWAEGGRTQAYLGRVSHELLAGTELSMNAWMERLLSGLREAASRRGANAVVDVRITLDPFADRGTRMTISGQAQLVSMLQAS